MIRTSPLAGVSERRDAAPVTDVDVPAGVDECPSNRIGRTERMRVRGW